MRGSWWALLLAWTAACAKFPSNECTDKATCSATGDDAGGSDATRSDDATEDVAPLPTCGTNSVCAAPAPSGWSGPGAFWQGAVGATPPGCATPFTAAGPSGHELPAGTPPAATCACDCAPSTTDLQRCDTQIPQLILYEHDDAQCAGAGGVVCDTVSLSGCQNTPYCQPNNTAPGSVKLVEAPSGGACSPKPGPPPPMPIAWDKDARLCAFNGAGSSDGCTANATCIPLPPSPFEPVVCVWRDGDVPCPLGPYQELRHVYQGAAPIDTRGCTACSCTSATPVGGTCAGNVGFWLNQGCMTTSWSSILVSDQCVQWNGGAVNLSVDLEGAMSLKTPGTCAGQAVTPTGGVTGASPTTVCCAP